MLAFLPNIVFNDRGIPYYDRVTEDLSVVVVCQRTDLIRLQLLLTAFVLIELKFCVFLFPKKNYC